MKNKILFMTMLSAMTMPTMAEGFYILGDVGQAKVEYDAGNDYSLSRTDTSYSIGAGYDFNKFAAIEVAYRDLGVVKDNGLGTDEAGDYTWSDKRRTTVLQASVVGKLPVSDFINVYGRLGVGSIDAETTITIDNDKFSDSQSKTKALAGIGASFNLTPDFAIRAEYNQFAKLDDTKLSALTVGATYSF